MPWESAGVSEQRVKFVVRGKRERESMTTLCGSFQISRTTGHCWRKRFADAKAKSRGNFAARGSRFAPNLYVGAERRDPPRQPAQRAELGVWEAMTNDVETRGKGTARGRR